MVDSSLNKKLFVTLDRAEKLINEALLYDSRIIKFDDDNFLHTIEVNIINYINKNKVIERTFYYYKKFQQ